jgi:hypothetical protein
MKYLATLGALATVGYAQTTVTAYETEVFTTSQWPEDLEAEVTSTEKTGWYKLDIHEGEITVMDEDFNEISATPTYKYKLWYGFKNWETAGMTTYTSKRSTGDWTGWNAQIGFHGENMFDQQPWINCVILNYGSTKDATSSPASVSCEGRTMTMATEGDYDTASFEVNNDLTAMFSEVTGSLNRHTLSIDGADVEVMDTEFYMEWMAVQGADVENMGPWLNDGKYKGKSFPTTLAYS